METDAGSRTHRGQALERLGHGGVGHVGADAVALAQRLELAARERVEVHGRRRRLHLVPYLPLPSPPGACVAVARWVCVDGESRGEKLRRGAAARGLYRNGSDRCDGARLGFSPSRLNV